MYGWYKTHNILILIYKSSSSLFLSKTLPTEQTVYYLYDTATHVLFIAVEELGR